MQSLMLIEDLFEPILRGTKHCTIRKGQRPIESGSLLFKSTSGNLQIEVNVTDVLVKHAGDITDEEAQKDGAKNAEDLLKNLRVFYPHLVDDDVVTIVTFERMAGTLKAVY